MKLNTSMIGVIAGASLSIGFVIISVAVDAEQKWESVQEELRKVIEGRLCYTDPIVTGFGNSLSRLSYA